MTTRKKWALGTAAGGAVGVFVGLWTLFGGDPGFMIKFKQVALTIGAMLELIDFTLAWPGDPPE